MQILDPVQIGGEIMCKNLNDLAKKVILSIREIKKKVKNKDSILKNRI